MFKKRFNLRNVVTKVACLAVSSMMFSSCNQSAKETKVDSNSNSHSAEKYSEQTSRVQELTGGNNVYWTESGTKYHIYDACTYISKGKIFNGTVAQALEMKNITGLCAVCEQMAAKKSKEDSNVAEEIVVTPNQSTPSQSVNRLITTNFYGYRKSLGNGKTFSFICELRTEDKNKTITRFVAGTETVVGNETRSKKISSTNEIEILSDNTFSIKVQESALNGKIEKNIIRGTVTINGEKFPFQAKTSNIETCEKCFGSGTSMEGSLLDRKACTYCDGFGKIPR